MQNIQPRNLTDRELVRYYAILLDRPEPVPVNWQTELLRRFLNKIAPTKPEDTPNY